MTRAIMMNSLETYFRHVLATSLENWHTYAYYFLYNNLSFCKCVSAIKPKEESWNGITMLAITSHKIIFHYQENPHNVHLIWKLLICSNLMTLFIEIYSWYIYVIKMIAQVIYSILLLSSLNVRYIERILTHEFIHTKGTS